MEVVIFLLNMTGHADSPNDEDEEGGGGGGGGGGGEDDEEEEKEEEEEEEEEEKGEGEGPISPNPPDPFTMGWIVGAAGEDVPVPMLLNTLAIYLYKINS